MFVPSTRVVRSLFLVVLILSGFYTLNTFWLSKSWNTFTTMFATNMCSENIAGLGEIKANIQTIKGDALKRKYPQLHLGQYSPTDCSPTHKVAIIVPYRNRTNHMNIFLNHAHEFLIKQNLEYGIYIIEQEGNSAFNRAKLMNVGFVESQKLKLGGWRCFVFHDIDLLPTNTKNIYSCSENPRHLSVAINVFNYTLPYEDIFGGVTAFTEQQFKIVNGFSNYYWGWGGEDDDIFRRVKKMKYNIDRPNASIARYVMLKHEKAEPNPHRYTLLNLTSEHLRSDGLSTLKYRVEEIRQYRLYTHILVNIDEAKDHILQTNDSALLKIITGR